MTDTNRNYSEINNGYRESYLVSPDGELIISDRDGLFGHSKELLETMSSLPTVTPCVRLFEVSAI